jgi:predicted outer membrane repeat protein
MKKYSGKNRSLRYVIALALALSALATTPAHAVASTIYVAPTGTVGTGASCASPGFVGGASIATAVAAAVDGDTIILCNGTFSVASQVFIDEKEITISGESSAQNTIINGAGSTTGIFKIISKKNVTIQNLTFYRGNSAQGGGAIYLSMTSSQSLSTTRHLVTNNIFAQNKASSQGGAISGVGDDMVTGNFRGILTISSNTFVENVAGMDGGAIDMGAVTFDPTRVVVQSNKFLYNVATGRAGGALVSNFSYLNSVGNYFYLNKTGDGGNAQTLYGGMKLSGDVLMNDLSSGQKDCLLDDLSPTVVTEIFSDNPYCTYFSGTQLAGITTITRAQGLATTGNFIPQSPLISAHSAALNSVTLTLGARGTGGSSITQYSYSLDGGAFANFPAGASLTQSITGLTAGTTYQVRLKATNSAGTSYESMPYEVSTAAAYNSSTGNGNFACSVTGYATMANFVVTSSSNCTGAVTVPAATTSIAGYAFEGSGVTSINIPNKVTTIGDAAFRAATSLTTVTFESGSTLTSIGSAAFERTAIASISLPSTLTSLGNYAFWSNSALTSIVIPEGVSALYQNTFAYITTLTSVTLPINLSYIDMETFKGATALTSLIIPNRVSSIGANAFTNTTALTTYTYCGTVSDADLTTAGLGGKTKTCAPPVLFDCPTGGGKYQVFDGELIGTSGVCSGDLVLDSSVTAIKYVSLQGTTITSLTIPASVRSMENPLYYTKEVVSIYVDSASTTFKSIDGVLFNFSGTLLIAYPASKPGTTYTIPSSVTDLGIYAFGSNKYLTSMSIPNGVISTGGVIFHNSQALTTVSIGTGLASLGGQDFAWNKTLTAINVEAANTSFASINGVLYNKEISALLSYPAGKAGTSYVAPSTVTSTATTAFGGIVNLLTADLSSVSTLSSQAFMDATSIQEVIFGDSLTLLSSQAFQSASALRKVTLGTGLSSIGYGAFYANDRLYCIIYAGSDSTIQNYSYPNGVVPVTSSSNCLANPAITLSNSTISGTIGTPINSYTISSTGGAVATYSISPSISYIPGLSFSTSTGIISGTPLYASSAQTFTVTATNAADVATRTLTIVVRPIPVPFLNSLTKPTMNLKDGKYVCTAGTYEFGYTIGGVIDAGTSGRVTPSKYTYYLLINGVADSALTVTTADATNTWNLAKPSSGSLITCTIAVTVNSLSVGALSTENTDGVAAAQSAQSAGIKTAEATYKAATKAIPVTYLNLIRSFSKIWKEQTDAARAFYYVTLERIKASGSSTKISETLLAREFLNTAKLQSEVQYSVAKKAAYDEKNKATKAAIEAKTIAIAKAKATYGTYIESIGHGVLIP